MQQDTRTIIKKCFLSNILKTHLDKKKKKGLKSSIYLEFFFHLNEQSVNFELATTEIN